MLVATTWSLSPPLLLTIWLFLVFSSLWYSPSDFPAHLQSWTCPHFWSSDLQFCCVVQLLSCVQLWDSMNCSVADSPVLYCLPEFTQIMSIESVMPSNHLILCYLLLLLTSIFPSIRVFCNELALHIRWPKYWNFRSVFSMNIQGWFPLGLTGLISLLSKGLSRVFSTTLKASVFRCSAFFTV